MNSYDLNSIIQNQIDINKSRDVEKSNDEIEKIEKTVKKDVEISENMKGQIQSIEDTLEEQGRMVVIKMITRRLTDL